jgi:hypothetical protein
MLVLLALSLKLIGVGTRRVVVVKVFAYHVVTLHPLLINNFN